MVSIHILAHAIQDTTAPPVPINDCLEMAKSIVENLEKNYLIELSMSFINPPQKETK